MLKFSVVYLHICCRNTVSAVTVSFVIARFRKSYLQ